MDSAVTKLSPPLKLPAFGEVEPARLLAVDDLFAVVSDKFPVSPGHTLIIARRPGPGASCCPPFQGWTGRRK